MTADVQVQTYATGFKGKVYNKLRAPTAVFAWRIKFPDDTPLSIIPEENFYITDSDNVLFDFLVRVEKSTNSAIITPNGEYDANVYYFLHIKKFKQGVGKNEKTLPPIHVGFKILDNGKLDLIWLKGKFDPETIMEKASKVTERKVSSIKQEYLGRIKFVYNMMPLKIVEALTCVEILTFNIITSLIGAAPQNLTLIHLIIMGVLIMGYIAQMILTGMEYRGGKREAVEAYNLGVSNFNVGNYQIAENYFSTAITANPNSEEVEKAVEINRKYLMKDNEKLLSGEMYIEKMKFHYNNALLMGAGVIGFLYCAMTAFNMMQWVSVANDLLAEYLKIFFVTSLILHLAYRFIQSKSFDFLSVKTYNKGVDLFDERELDDAVTTFRLALKYNHGNARANAAKELASFISMREKYKAEQEAFEAECKAKREEIEKEIAKEKAKSGE